MGSPEAQMMKFKPLDDCEVHGVWAGALGRAALRRMKLEQFLPIQS